MDAGHSRVIDAQTDVAAATWSVAQCMVSEIHCLLGEAHALLVQARARSATREITSVQASMDLMRQAHQLCEEAHVQATAARRLLWSAIHAADLPTNHRIAALEHTEKHLKVLLLDVEQLLGDAELAMERSRTLATHHEALLSN